MWKKLMIWLNFICPKCHGKLKYNEGWDRYECTKCNYDSREGK